MIAWLVARTGFSPLAIKLLGGVVAIAAVVCLVWWMRADAYSDGRKAEQAEWRKAELELRKELTLARDAADALARQREQQDNRDMEDLRNAARKGNDAAVGDGVRAVLDGVRARQAR